MNTVAPETDGLGDEVAAVWLFSHFANAARGITTAVVRMTACPRPQSSVQITGYVPILFGVMCSVGWRPGTVSCFWPNSGTQNEWITSFDVKVKSTERLTGSRSVPVVRFLAPG